MKKWSIQYEIPPTRGITRKIINANTACDAVIKLRAKIKILIVIRYIDEVIED